MPFTFIIAGLVLVIAGVRGTSDDLVTLVKGDFTGDNNFVYWVLAILVIGGVGYIPSLKSFSRAFLALVLIVLILAEGKQGNGFFTEFESAVKQITEGNG